MYSMFLAIVLSQGGGYGNGGDGMYGMPSGGSVPVPAMARLDAKGKLTLCTVVPEARFMKTYKFQKDGAWQESSLTTKGYFLMVVEVDAATVKGQTVDGKDVPASKLASQLGKERPVLVVSDDGDKIDSFHLQLYRPDALVLIVPPGLVGEGGYGSGGYAAVGDPPTEEPAEVLPAPKEKTPPKKPVPPKEDD